MTTEEAINILGLKSPFTAKDAKKAYRTEAKIHHPDKGGSAVEFNRVNQAYDICQAGSVVCEVRFPGYEVFVDYGVPDIDRNGIKDFFKTYCRTGRNKKKVYNICSVVDWFKEKMIQRLHEPRCQLDWRKTQDSELLRKLGVKLIELAEALKNKGERNAREKVIDSCIDVSCFSMFIADKARIKKGE